MNTFDQDELLNDVAKSLREISLSLASIYDGIAIARRRAPRTLGTALNANYHYYIAGGRTIRDGDSYGIVARQPPIQDPSPEPPVHADDQARNLRASDQRRS